VQDGATEEGEGGFSPARRKWLGGGSERLQQNDGSCASPPPTKGQVEGEGATGVSTEGKPVDKRDLTGEAAVLCSRQRIKAGNICSRSKTRGEGGSFVWRAIR
jgi:hypothetical protein